MVRTAAEPFGPGRRNPEPSKARWTLRDTLAGLLLFLATACVVLWQNAHVAILWDTSYVLDSAVRFALGQDALPSLSVCSPPLTFLIQAAIIRFTGRVFFHHVLYVAAVGGLATVLTWRLLRSNRCAGAAPEPGQSRCSWRRRSPSSASTASSPSPNTTATVPSGFSSLCGSCSGREQTNEVSRVSVLARVGPAFVWMRYCRTLPLFAKQNMGLPFLLASVGSGFACARFRGRAARAGFG
jgi:hypothetical protein